MNRGLVRWIFGIGKKSGAVGWSRHEPLRGSQRTRTSASFPIIAVAKSATSTLTLEVKDKRGFIYIWIKYVGIYGNRLGDKLYLCLMRQFIIP